MPCPTCVVLQCSETADTDTYNFQSGLIFTNGALSFVENCPPGYICFGNGYPITITIPPETIKLPVPPTQFPTGTDIFLSIKCCQSTISRTVPRGSTQAQLEAIANAMIQECAAQQAACDVITQPPGPGLPPPTPVNPPGSDIKNTKVDLRNSLVTASKSCGSGNTGTISRSIAAGTYGSTLYNATATQIATEQARLNALASAEATRLLNLVTPPVITNSSPLTAGEVGTAYSQQLNGSGGTAPYVFSLASGALPNGLTISSTGLISGTPTNEGTAVFTVRIMDANGDSCSKSFSLEIAPEPLCPQILATPNANASKQQLAYDPVQQDIFFTRFNDQTAYRFDPATNTSNGSVAGSWYPGGITYLPAQTIIKQTSAPFTAPAVGFNVQIALNNVVLVLVGQILTVEGKNYEVISLDGGNLITIENINDTPGNNVPMGEPVSFAFIGGLLFSAHDVLNVSGALFHLDATTLVVTKVVSLTKFSESANTVMYLSGSNKVLITLPQGFGFDVFDVATGGLTNVPGTYAIFGAAYNVSAGRVYLLGFETSQDTIHALNHSTFTITNSFNISPPVGVTSANIGPFSLCYCSTNNHIYVGIKYFFAGAPSSNEHYVYIINANTFTLIESLLLFSLSPGNTTPLGPQLAYSSDQDLVYIGYGSGTGEPSRTAIIDPLIDDIACTLNEECAAGVECLSKSSFYSKDWSNFTDLIETDR